MSWVLDHSEIKCPMNRNTTMTVGKGKGASHILPGALVCAVVATTLFCPFDKASEARLLTAAPSGL